MPVGVRRRIGVAFRSTSDTFGSLNASYHPLTNGGRFSPKRWSLGMSCSATAGSRTIARTFSAMNSHQSALIAGSVSRSV